MTTRARAELDELRALLEDPAMLRVTRQNVDGNPVSSGKRVLTGTIRPAR